MDKLRILWIGVAWIILCYASVAHALEVGDVVWAQWKPNAWYHGKVTKVHPIGFHVAFDDGDQANLPSSLIVSDSIVAAEELKVGVRVIALWNDGKYYPGTFTGAKDGRYNIRFDDWDKRPVELSHIRLRKASNNTRADIKIGDVVWAQWKPNVWYHGKVAKVHPIGFHVTFDDGDRMDLPASLIVSDRIVAAEQLKKGIRVLARWNDGKYYPGTVTGSKGRKYDIRFDDGDGKAVDLNNIRLLYE